MILNFLTLLSINDFWDVIIFLYEVIGLTSLLVLWSHVRFLDSLPARYHLD